ncbi:heme-binding domain-containing protein [Riemerella columbipharyngis]|uniref:Haem-binding domain-containing protein n=1 Tax=Riemerella columbipharyngis TaxID=1071918 RepID=A0A1G7AGT0_9FLAO|nr:heme-binding domain-containing protein [Riemerella columbipharyngis]SDE13096.1 Haem-binding domain-containing protein [Riemerella columbipharyngis]
MKKFFRILIGVFAGLVLIQLIPVDRDNPPVNEKDNFVTIYKTPPQMVSILRNACYDCHSNETVYPWYAYVAPVSWSIKHHVNKGREHLNFSTWGSANAYLKKSALEHSIEELQELGMPPIGYISQHPKANLTTQQRKLLEDYFRTLLDQGAY